MFFSPALSTDLVQTSMLDTVHTEPLVVNSDTSTSSVVLITTSTNSNSSSSNKHNSSSNKHNSSSNKHNNNNNQPSKG